jgi:hypothetical protein
MLEDFRRSLRIVSNSRREEDEAAKEGHADHADKMDKNEIDPETPSAHTV